MIEPGRFEQIERLYHSALEREPEAREAFLDEACAGDEALRREVAGLLAYDHPSDSFIQSPAIEIAAKALAAESFIEASANPMRSPVGVSQIGAYQLLEPLGRGGMGEVHLALDNRLGRKVAIKFLPAAFTTDADRVQRFAREARAASALNHPNIITIHEIGEAATENGSLRYIVTEYVEGETLRQRIARAPQLQMKPLEAIDVAAQIAAALAAAHEAGITHRDIKPENVMVRRDGIVKVLDFGLAKLTESASPVIDSQSTTRVRNSTDAGVVMGTPRYMSPEQARGEKVDARTDIFSLGVALYEMIAGRAPFVGTIPGEVIASILRDAPPPLAECAPDAPQELERIAGKALRKDREERYQVVKDLLFDLMSVKQELELEAKLKRTEAPETIARQTAGSESSRAPSSAEYIVSEIKRHKRGVAAGLATLAIATAAFVWFILSNRQAPETDQIPANRTLTRLTFDDGLQSEPSWSPDGRFIAYSSDRGGNSDILVRQVDGGDPVQVTKSPAHDWQPDWSPDGANIVFRSERDGGGLFVVSALGGNERKIASFGFRPRWSPDGSKILFLSSYLSLIGGPRMYVVALDGDAPREVLADLRGEFARQQGAFVVAWGPDSQRVSLWGFRLQMGWGLWTGSISGGSPIKSEVAPSVDQQIKDASVSFGNFTWAKTGRAIYFEGYSKGIANIWRVVVEPQTLRWVGGPERLTVGPGTDTDIALSPDGKKLAFTTRTNVTRAWSLPFNALTGRTIGTGQPVTPAGVRVNTFDLSVDGSMLAFVIHRAGKNEIWKKTLADGQETLLRAADDYDIYQLRWSPDGRSIAYGRFRLPITAQSEVALSMLSSTGGGEQLLATPSTSIEIPDGWSADGKWLLISSSRNTPGRNQICRMPVNAAPSAETGVRVITSHPEYNLWQANYSPNERWIVFQATKVADPGVSTIYTLPASGGEWTRITEDKYGDGKPRWAPDGRKLYFLSSRGGVLNVWGIRYDPLNGKPEGEPFRITNFQGPSRMFSPVITIAGIALSANRLFLPILENSGSIWVLENLDR